MTPSATDATILTTTYGSSTSFTPITAADRFFEHDAFPVRLPGVEHHACGRSIPDDTDASTSASPSPAPTPTTGSTPPPNAFPDAAYAKSAPSGTTGYFAMLPKYFTMLPSIYEPTSCAGGLTYRARLTISPTSTSTLRPNPITVTRYFQSSQVSPFSYNIFTEGSFEDYDWGQSFDSEASIYASVQVKMDHKGTIINGPVRYGGSFVDPDGNVNGTSDLVFQDPNTGATVDPYSSGLLRQVSKIEVVPDIVDVIAHNSDGTRSASAETAPATADDFSRREIIEPPANLSGDTAPDQVAQRRIYTQADLRLKVSVGTKTITTGKTSITVPVATGTFYNTDGSVLAQYSGTHQQRLLDHVDDGQRRQHGDHRRHRRRQRQQRQFLDAVLRSEPPLRHDQQLLRRGRPAHQRQRRQRHRERGCERRRAHHAHQRQPGQLHQQHGLHLGRRRRAARRTACASTTAASCPTTG